jgi:hypothetical protein
MREGRRRTTLEAMAEVHSSVDRLEGRIDHLAGRVDTLYSILEAREMLSPPADRATGDALFDELLQIEEAPFAQESRARPTRRRGAARLRVGTGTGV